MRKVIIVGQTPPPVGGQAAMIRILVDAHLEGVQTFHVELGAATSSSDRGRIRVGKIAHLLSVVVRTLWLRWRTRADTLYYPPSAELAPVLRDAFVLAATRWAFATTIFHFHAGGLGETLQHLPRVVRGVVARPFKRPQLAIRMSTASPDDPAAVGALREMVIPYGLPDRPVPNASLKRQPPMILFAGVIRESKGVLVALQALGLLASEGHKFQATFAGPWTSEQFRDRVMLEVRRLGLSDLVKFPGVPAPDTYMRLFDEAFAFSFPTFFESESFSVVVVEAMRAALPVVTTRWRGLPALVHDQVTGYLVEPHDPHAVAARLASLLADPAHAAAMGQQGRRLYEDNYRVEMFLERMTTALSGG